MELQPSRNRPVTVSRGGEQHRFDEEKGEGAGYAFMPTPEVRGSSPDAARVRMGSLSLSPFSSQNLRLAPRSKRNGHSFPV